MVGSAEKGLATAVVGLGSMGWGAAVSLVRAGFATTGVDIREDVLSRFGQVGGSMAPNPAEAAKSADIVFVFVVNEAQTRQVLFGENGALGTARPGTVFVLCVTMPPSAAERIAEDLTDRGMLKPGLRADMVRVGHEDGVPIVREVWREGRRVV